MSSNEVIGKYRKILFGGKIVSAIFIMLALPKIIIGFTDINSILGINSGVAFWLFIVGTVFYTICFLIYYKCPACKKYPGNGWSLKKCQSCGEIINE